MTAKSQVCRSMSGITPEQCLAARAMLRMRREDLAVAAKVAAATLFDFEAGRRKPHPRTIEAIRLALEAAGTTFLETNDDGPGIRVLNKSVCLAEEDQAKI